MSVLARLLRRLRPAAPAVRPGSLALSPELADHLLDALADGCEFHPCPSEKRRRPHAVRADGSRRCWECGHEIPGVDHD